LLEGGGYGGHGCATNTDKVNRLDRTEHWGKSFRILRRVTRKLLG
jgi:hypothetical protein